MSYQHVQNSRTLRKKEMVYVMGGQCQLCGYDKAIEALEFHHINPDEKELSFNKAISVSWEKTDKELQKCILLCANCHREVHANFENFTNLESSYNANRAKEVSLRINRLKHHQDRYCPCCGKVISAKAKLCEECSKRERRIVERPSREELKSLIRTLPFVQIAKQFHVSDNAIRKWCDSYNLPRRVVDIKNISDEEWTKI